MQVKVSDTLGVEPTPDKKHLRIVREGAGLVVVELSEVKDLVNALSELSARLAADQVGDDG